MAQNLSDDLARLARWARTLEQKNELCEQLHRRLEAVELAGVAVAGEAEMLSRLEGRFQEAITLLENLEKSDNAETGTRFLDDLEQLLSDVDWEVAEQVLEDLVKKDEEQKQNIRKYEAKIAEWTANMESWLSELEKAQKARAPVIQEKRELLRLKDLVKQAERTLRDQKFGLLEEPVAQLEAAKDRPKELLESIQEKIKTNKPLSRQADLLLLRTSKANNCYEYTVLLRTPSEPGSHGINIQDSSTLVKQDHAELNATVDRITKQVNAGLARQFSPSPVIPAGTQSEASETEGVVAGLDGAAEIRTFRPDPVEEPVRWQNLNNLARDMGDLMYRLCLPEPMQRYLNDTQCALTITTNDLELPWELMCLDNKFLCLERPLARLPMGQAFPRMDLGVVQAEGKIRFLLIYADPEGNLVRAGEEIKKIKEDLEKEWQEQIEIELLWREDAQGRKLNEALRSGRYSVIHYAGHASFDEADADLSALVLHEKELFFGQKIRRLLEGRPLVFLNACETGRTANEKNPQEVASYLQKPAEGLASSFIYGGALGCIGALWPIYDEYAAKFAVIFYNKVLQGHMIGEAMRLARRQMREEHPEQITWAAFVLYGDPTFRLVE